MCVGSCEYRALGSQRKCWILRTRVVGDCVPPKVDVVTELRTLERTVYALKHSVIFLAPKEGIFNRRIP